MHKKQGCILAFLTQNNSLKKSSKKVLTKGKESGKIVKLSARAVATILTLKKTLKKLKKSFKKVLTKGKGCGIILRLSRESEQRNGH